MSKALDTIEDQSHSLLELPSPPYSSSTVRRAMAVWLHCGQKNSFRAVCDYYHRLEKLEDQLPEDRRALSRHPELDLLSNQPPMSAWLKQNYPRLYTQAEFNKQYIQKLDTNQRQKSSIGNSYKKNCDEGKNARSLEKKETKEEMKNERDSGATKQEILETSRMIGGFCKNSKIALQTFLQDFKDHALKCELKDTVSNVTFYIKRKMIHDEMMKDIEAGKFANLKKLSSSENSKDHAQMPSVAEIESKTVKNGPSTYEETMMSEKKNEIDNTIDSKVLETAVKELENSIDSMKLKSEAKLAGKLSYPIRILKREKSEFQNKLEKNETLKFRKI